MRASRVFGNTCIGLGLAFGLLLFLLAVAGNRPDLVPFLSIVSPLCVTAGVVILLTSTKNDCCKNAHLSARNRKGVCSQGEDSGCGGDHT